VSNYSWVERDGEGVKAPQILNQIDKMNKRYPEFRNAYDHLSDIVHPNGLGAVVYFGTFTTDSRMRFDDGGAPRSAERAHASLIMAVVLLLHVNIAFAQTEERLKTLSAYMTAQRG
jgi:hypothetical protein